jgi:hypothetical protein
MGVVASPGRRQRAADVLRAGRELELRDLFVAADALLDPQAHVLHSDVVLDLAEASS